VETPYADVGVGDIFVTASDISEAITWLATHMGTKFTFTQGMRSLSNPLAAWSAKKGYKGLKKHPGDSTVPAKVTILDYLSLILLSTDPSRAIEAAAWTASDTATGQGFSASQAEKVAVEMRAMDAARSYFASVGWLEDQADADAHKHESFDLILRHGDDVKHVEVKGTTQIPKGSPDDAGIKVFLTRNEVDHARGQCKAAVKCQSIALFILFGIKLITAPTEPPTATGGFPLVRDPWNLNRGTLEPAVYSYHV
jgi:hypothetical protein